MLCFCQADDDTRKAFCSKDFRMTDPYDACVRINETLEFAKKIVMDGEIVFDDQRVRLMDVFTGIRPDPVEYVNIFRSWDDDYLDASAFRKDTKFSMQKEYGIPITNDHREGTITLIGYWFTYLVLKLSWRCFDLPRRPAFFPPYSPQLPPPWLPPPPHKRLRRRMRGALRFTLVERYFPSIVPDIVHDSAPRAQAPAPQSRSARSRCLAFAQGLSCPP